MAAAFAPGAMVAAVARQHDVATSLIYKWRRTVRAVSGAPRESIRFPRNRDIW
ncbi:transposase [Mesorhizobium tamadayense]|uniref:transposase n=1 Tax=Mesorhizobium tamadayense TaxID=425306 RepID=UPI003CCB4E02